MKCRWKCLTNASNHERGWVFLKAEDEMEIDIYLSTTNKRVNFLKALLTEMVGCLCFDTM